MTPSNAQQAPIGGGSIGQGNSMDPVSTNLAQSFIFRRLHHFAGADHAVVRSFIAFLFARPAVGTISTFRISEDD